MANWVLDSKAQRDDPYATPRACWPIPRTSSTGAPENNVGTSGHGPDDNSPITGNGGRLVSRSKTFFLKAVPGRSYSGSKAQNVIRQISSTLSKRIKRHRHTDHSSSFNTEDDSLASSAVTGSDSEAIMGAGVTSRMSSHTSAQAPSPLPSVDSLCTMGIRGSFILCPQINVTPELSIVDSSTCSVWVALEVTGVLRRSDGHGDYSNGAHRYPPHSGTQLSGMST
jgi:hypothetical protein